MALTQLSTPILDGGIKSIHFFNGRLLSAEDLSQEQAANKQGRQQLGQSIGDGVAYGLEVQEAGGSKSSKQSPVVTIKAGLALNRQGQTLPLSKDVDVALVRPTTSNTSTVTALFADCQPLQQGPYVVGKGVYLLTIQTASVTEGKAPVSGLGNIDAACNAKYQIDGVQFRLIQLPITAAEFDAAGLRLRNYLAQRCLGSNDNKVTGFFANPFGPAVSSYGLLDSIRPDCLLDDEVPLALIYWTVANGLEFIDLWAVRRRITARSTDARWRLLTADQREAEAEALFLQFEAQIEETRARESNLTSLRAIDRFVALPPVGLLPLGGAGSSVGITYEKFFEDLPYRAPAYITGRQIEAIVQEALRYPPIRMAQREAVMLYRIIEAPTPDPCVLFVSAYLPLFGEPRFDTAHWDFSNFPREA
jgi:hypothetical protein